MRKYGSENFKIQLLEECELLNIYEREKQIILELDTYKNGLNTTLGGEGCLGYTHSEEIRQKISQNLKNGKSHKGKKYEEIYGKNSDEEKEKRKESVKKMWKDLSEDKKNERVQKAKETARKKSKYGEKMIKDIKEKILEGYTLKDIKSIYPYLKDNYYYTLKNNKRWKDL